MPAAKMAVAGAVFVMLMICMRCVGRFSPGSGVCAGNFAVLARVFRGGNGRRGNQRNRQKRGNEAAKPEGETCPVHGAYIVQNTCGITKICPLFDGAGQNVPNLRG